MAVRARELTIELIEQMRPRGRCEFLRDFAHIMPVVMFLGIVDLPVDKRQQFIEWGAGFVGATDQAARDRCMKAIVAYLRSLPSVKNKVPGPFGPTETATGFVMKIVPPGGK